MSGNAAGADVGGTFTDIVLLRPGAPPQAVKAPTTGEDQSGGVRNGLQAAGGSTIATLAHGTTTATNAVLERTTARTVLVTTAGFADLLVIARQNRPSLYDLAVTRPAPLVPSDQVVTVNERMGPDGAPVIALDDDEIGRVCAQVSALEPEAVAICLLFSYAGPAHEQRLADELARRLDVPISISSALLPEFREYERASTCVLDAAVAPMMRRYLRRLVEQLPDTTVTVMTSGGGVADVEDVAAAPVHTLLSGPAAGVVAAAAVARQEGFADGVAFDMGGTSTDACLIRGGHPAVASEGTIGGLPFATPAVAVHTVGAGGGSIAWLDSGGALRVGPQSAGAVPGPACYGHGGTAPTVTDAHAVLGHLAHDQALGTGDLRLDTPAAEGALRSLSGFTDAPAAAEGVLTVVRATMLRALRRVTTERGVDPSRLALIAYGGAGPLHASALARALGCGAAIIPAAPGVLSALGLLLAPPRREAARTVMAMWHRGGSVPDLDEVWAQLEADARSRVANATMQWIADCRYAGQSHELRIHRPSDDDLAAALDVAHQQAYGYAMPDEPVEVVTLRAIAQGAPVLTAPPPRWDHGDPTEPTETVIHLGGGPRSVPLLHRAALQPGNLLAGPAVIAQPDSTTLLAPQDRAVVTDAGNLVVRW